MPLQKRLVAIAFLSVRILNIVVSGIQLRHVNAFDNDGRSLSMSLWPWMMCGQVLHTVTIISTCVPFLREFLESFPSGMLKPAGLDSTGSWHGSRSIRLSDSGSNP
ncbi:hypothetical protein VN97_g6095 [Penicillium thymicola]|uniref:Uncharacterized protein n=1 Tax=Penicillium thymicola TaxID=293382 RepID=A0AAI9X8D0_PENTH|nr:hypothetical protein VN97_g6095 [Penicillium thymicola]